MNERAVHTGLYKGEMPGIKYTYVGHKKIYIIILSTSREVCPKCRTYAQARTFIVIEFVDTVCYEKKKSPLER